MLTELGVFMVAVDQIFAMLSILCLAGIGLGIKCVCQGHAVSTKPLGYGDQSPVSGAAMNYILDSIHCMPKYSQAKIGVCGMLAWVSRLWWCIHVS